MTLRRAALAPAALLALALAGPGPARAAPVQISDCAAIADADGRLACYDRLSRPAAPEPPPAAAPTVPSAPAAPSAGNPFAPVPTAPKWRVTHERSLLDGTEQVFLSLVGTSLPSVDSFGRRQVPILWLRCIAGNTALFVNGPGFEGSGVEITYWIDDTPPESATWTIAPETRSAGIFDSAGAAAFARALMKAERLILFTSLAGSPMRMTFAISGLAEASRPLRQACDWQGGGAEPQAQARVPPAGPVPIPRERPPL